MSPMIRKLRGLATAAALTLTLLPNVAHAGDLDEIALSNGGLVKGTILVLDPGAKVVIRVPGEDAPRTIPWSEVRGVERADDVDVPVDDDKAEGVRLHVRSDDPDVEVHSVQSTSVGMVGGHSAIAVHTRLECRAPCDKELDPDGKRYFFAGPGIPASQPFFLDRHGDSVTADVEAGSSGLMVGGYSMGILGGTALLTGIAFTAVAFALDDPELGENTFEDFKIGGPIMIGGGAALMIGGVVMMVVGGTDYEIRPETTNFGGYDVPTGRFQF